jgi:hypothetical protein
MPRRMELRVRLSSRLRRRLLPPAVRLLLFRGLRLLLPDRRPDAPREPHRARLWYQAGSARRAGALRSITIGCPNA